MIKKKVYVQYAHWFVCVLCTLSIVNSRLQPFIFSSRWMFMYIYSDQKVSILFFLKIAYLK